jgi:hypothetical protein
VTTAVTDTATTNGTAPPQEEAQLAYTPPPAGTTGPTVIELLIKAMQKVKSVGKTQRNDQQKYNFRGIDDVVNAANPVFKTLSILVIPRVRTATYRDVMTVKGNPQREVTVQVVFAFYGPRGDCLEAVVPGESMDSSDKGTAKAMSVALRIALIQVLMLPTKDLHPDPDSEAPQRGRSVSGSAAQREADQPSRETLLANVLTVSEQVRQLRGESEYAAADKLVKYCQDKLGVNVIKSQNEDGAVEEIDLAKLKDAQLLLLLNVMTKALRDLRSAGQVV